MSNLTTYKGGCHCGKARYEVELDLSEQKANKCNCSWCQKVQFLSLNVPKDDGKDTFSRFKLVSPASHEELGDYRFDHKGSGHFFCKDCGVNLFCEGRYELCGEMVHTLGLNAVTLDFGQVDLRKFKVSYWDGRTDNWEAGQKDEPYEGGYY